MPNFQTVSYSQSPNQSDWAIRHKKSNWEDWKVFIDVSEECTLLCSSSTLMMEAVCSSNTASNDLPDYAASYPITSRSANGRSCGDVTTEFLSVIYPAIAYKSGRRGGGKPKQPQCSRFMESTCNRNKSWSTVQIPHRINAHISTGQPWNSTRINSQDNG
jgi:hypothetical protein